MKNTSFWISIVLVGVFTACQSESISRSTTVPTKNPTAKPPPTVEEVISNEPLELSITLGNQNINNGITQDTGGDVDTITANPNSVEARKSGNGIALASADGNSVPDSYFQFNVDDDQMFAGSPTGHVRLEVDYLDQGTDTFTLEYDASPTSASNGIFTGGGAVVKTDSGELKTVGFNLCDAHFANRDNAADFRIGDDTNGAETIREVRVIGLESGAATAIRVDDFGANPFDDQPDSDAIQLALDSSCSGDTIVFTSGVNTSGYQGYLVDKTLFLTGMSAKHDLMFTSSDPQNHALLRATQDLKGYVVRLYAISRFSNNQDIYNIDFGHIDVHGGRDVRVCTGPDGIGNGVDDNWGSWLPICMAIDNPGCLPGNMSFDGAYSGVIVHDLVSQQGECGSGLSLFGSNGTIDNVIIDTVGDHVHNSVCANTDSDSDGDWGTWSDGMTVGGRNLLITNNTIIDPSDVGIVSFGGANTIISNNIVKITPGNYGAFAAIALHPWDLADTSGIQITGNIITSEGDSSCGGLHVGINIGSHMWNGGCVQNYVTGTYGNPTCSTNPDPDQVAPCTGDTCQIWAVLPEGETFTLMDNSVTGAHINYLVEGFLIKGQFIDENNISLSPHQSDWRAARFGCYGFTWGPLDKVAHHPSLPGYTDLMIHCTSEEN
jgi:hypothetical protein